MGKIRALILAGIVVLTSSVAGCKGCRSGSGGESIQTSPAATAFIVVTGRPECNDAVICGDPDVRMTLDLAKDFAKPVDWEKESDVWSENHDLDQNLPKDCAAYDKVLGLYRTRQKLFYIHRKLTTAEDYYKDPEWFRNRSYYDLLFKRDAGRLRSLFSDKRDAVLKAVALDGDTARQWGLFARELLRYHQMVLSTPGWEDKFRELAASDKDLVSGVHFHEAGFPRTDNVCYHLEHVFGGNPIVGYDHGLEGWFYSFWVRRNQEGAMGLVKEVLEWASARLPSGTAAHAQTMKAAGPVAEGADDPETGRGMGRGALGILCNIRGGPVTLRSKPEWGAPAVETQRCGAVVDIIAESARRTRPERESDRYSALSYERFGAYWYKARVAASGAVGWVYSGELFQWDGGNAPVDGTPAFDAASDLYSPSKEEDGHEVDDDIELPFLYVKGSPYVFPLSAGGLTEAGRRPALITDDLAWFVVVRNSSIGHVESRHGSVWRKGKGYDLILSLELFYQEGGQSLPYSGYWEKGKDAVAVQ